MAASHTWPGQRRIGSWIAGSDRDHEGRRHIVESFGEVGQEPQGEVVRPGKVVNQDHHWTLLGKVECQPVETMDDTENVRGLPEPEDGLGQRRWTPHHCFPHPLNQPE